MANQVAYGFINLTDIFSSRVANQNFEVVATAIQQSIDEHNRQLDALFSLFATRINPLKPQVRYRAPTLVRSQPLDQNGRARPIRLAAGYDVGFPIQASGNAWGGNYVSMQKLTISEANEYTLALIGGDVRWMRDHILAALFTNVTWTFTDDDDGIGALTIQGLANADSVVYSVQTGADAGVTDNHYLAQAAAISDAANPYPAIYTELVEHPENAGQVVALVPTNLMATTKALTNYIPASDPNISSPSTASALSGNLGAAVPGMVRGYVDGVWIVEWTNMVSSYIIAVTTDGDRPLGMREDPEASLNGFHQVAVRNDYPWEERQYMRRAGFGGRNRVGAVVQRIGNASYAIPTGFDSPMS